MADRWLIQIVRFIFIDLNFKCYLKFVILNYMLFIHSSFRCVCVLPHIMYVEVRGQPVGVASLLPCGSQVLNSGYQAGQQVFLPHQLPYQLLNLIFIKAAKQ